jgi:membrane associated rhomboid family serine protease
MTVSQFRDFTSAFLGTVVGASGAIYGVIVAFAFMFPNAELANVHSCFQSKQKYFVPGLVLVDLYLGISGQSIFGGGIAHFAHVGGALFGFNHVVLEKKISSTIIAGIKYYKKLFETNSKLKT